MDLWELFNSELAKQAIRSLSSVILWNALEFTKAHFGCALVLLAIAGWVLAGFYLASCCARLIARAVCLGAGLSGVWVACRHWNSSAK